MDELKTWINTDYLNPALLRQMKEAYQRQQSVQLRAFLTASQFKRLQRDAMRASRTVQSVPDMFCHDAIKLSGTMLSFGRFLRSKAFAQLLSFIAGRKVACASIEWQSFGQGQYTLLHDTLRQERGIYLFFDLSARWDEAWGGYTSVVKDGDELARISPRANALTFLTLKGKARHFTKYVDHKAGRRRRLVLVARFKARFK